MAKYVKLRCVALRTVRHSDTTSVLTLYTASQGRLAAAVPSGPGGGARRLRALTLPMTLLECEAQLRPGLDMAVALHDVRPLAPAPCATPLQSVVALFAADVLEAVVRESLTADAGLSSFVEEAALRLALMPHLGSPQALANFPLALLVGLTRPLGVAPDRSTFTPGSVMDMPAGRWRPSPPLHSRFLPSAEAEAAFHLCRMTLRNCGRYRLERPDRNAAIDRALQYLAIHLQQGPSSTGLDILRRSLDF